MLALARRLPLMQFRRALSSAASVLVQRSSDKSALSSIAEESEPAIEPLVGSFDCIDVRLREAGKRERKRLRKRSGRIPGILQGRNVFDDVLLDIPLAPLRRAQQAGLLVVQSHSKVMFCGPLFTLRVKNDSEGRVPFSTVRTLPVNMLIHPLTEEIVNVSFVLAPVDEKVRVRVPIRILNAEKCPALRSGGWINMIHRAVDINVVPGVAPPLFASVDISGMQLKDRKLVKDLEFVGKGSGCATVRSDDDLAVVLSKV